MIARTQNGRIKLLSALRHGMVVMGVAFLLAVGGLSAEIVLKNRNANDFEHENAQLVQQIKVTNGEVERADRMGAVESPTDAGAVGALQSKLYQIARDNKCSVTEFHASPEVSPYLSRFSKTTSVTGWGQISVQLTLSGSARNVQATLASLIDSKIPFEFDTLNLARDKADAIGDVTVSGKANLRVLIRTDKGNA